MPIRYHYHRVSGAQAAQSLAAQLIESSIHFTFEPDPDDMYEFGVKEESKYLLERLLAQPLLSLSGFTSKDGNLDIPIRGHQHITRVVLPQPILVGDNFTVFYGHGRRAASTTLAWTGDLFDSLKAFALPKA